MKMIVALNGTTDAFDISTPLSEILHLLQSSRLRSAGLHVIFTSLLQMTVRLVCAFTVH